MIRANDKRFSVGSIEDEEMPIITEDEDMDEDMFSPCISDSENTSPKTDAITSHSQFPNPSLLHDPSNTLPKLCDYPDCQHLLSLEVIKFTCPACHSTYCHSHSGKSSFEMQLDKDGVFDAQKGFWQRVCQRCYENRPG